MNNERAPVIDELGSLSRLRVAVDQHVAVVTLDAPPVNAQDRLMREELVRTFDVLSSHSEVRAVVVTGAGRAFCAGADLTERTAIAEEAGGFARHNRLVRSMLDAVGDCPKPVLAAVNGPAVGGGCVLALSCDILVVAQTAFVAMPEVEHGLAGGAAHVLRAFGSSDARLLIYTGRRFAGPELLRMNVASVCCPAERVVDEARAIALEIAGKMPLAVAAAKRSFDLAPHLPVREAYRHEQRETLALVFSDDARELSRARAAGRQPRFINR